MGERAKFTSYHGRCRLNFKNPSRPKFAHVYLSKMNKDTANIFEVKMTLNTFYVTTQIR
jgi:hypothetical protein